MRPSRELNVKLIDTISDYFLTQRVKPDQENYPARLVKHPTVIVSSMKTKQQVDEKYVSQSEKKH